MFKVVSHLLAGEVFFKAMPVVSTYMPFFKNPIILLIICVRVFSPAAMELP